MDVDDDLERSISGIAALDQPMRRSLYRLLAAANGSWTSRDEASDALDIARPVAAFHLDRLVDAGVLETRFERRTGRSGPGAGRPSKLYRPVDGELSASVPARHYDLAASLLATAVVEATRTTRPVAQCVHDVAHAAGRRIGADAHARTGDERHDDPGQVIVDILRDYGYEPEPDDDREIALANCPFHRLAEQQRDLVCGMNLDFLSGIVDGLELGDALTARLQPEPGVCCVRVSTC